MSWDPKDPQAKLDYQFDWSRWLQPGEQIVSSTFSAPPSLTLSKQSIDGGFTTFWAAGGIPGEACKITNHIITNQEREDDKTDTLRIRQR